MPANRNLIHVNKLEEFKAFCVERGCEVLPIPPASAFEVLRLKYPNSAKPMIFYRRGGCEHLTVQFDQFAQRLAEAFIKVRRASRRAAKNGGV